MSRLGKRKSLALLLPLLIGFAFQATQYARAPVDYEYYVVYGKNADIALKPGTDLSPNGQTLIQNSSSQEGLYTLSLGKWGILKQGYYLVSQGVSAVGAVLRTSIVGGGRAQPERATGASVGDE